MSAPSGHSALLRDGQPSQGCLPVVLLASLSKSASKPERSDISTEHCHHIKWCSFTKDEGEKEF